MSENKKLLDSHLSKFIRLYKKCDLQLKTGVFKLYRAVTLLYISPCYVARVLREVVVFTQRRHADIYGSKVPGRIPLNRMQVTFLKSCLLKSLV